MRYPEFLQPGEAISFIAPSFGCSIEPYQTGFDHALKVWRDKGYKTLLGPNCYADKGVGISNTPKLCAKELMGAFCGKGPISRSRAVISCGGGELMCEILPYLDFDLLRESGPKWFMGYSDNTNLSFPLAVLCDTASIYGPCAPAFGMEPRHEAVQMAEDLLTGKRLSFEGFPSYEKESLKTPENPLASYNLTERSIKRMFHGTEHRAELNLKGRLLGGCLDILVTLCGTKFDRVREFVSRYRDDGILWFLEACDLTPMSLRRALFQLREAGWFEGASGFVFGRPMHMGEEMLGLNMTDAVLGILGELDLPILLDADLGHLPPAIPIVQGALGEVSAADGAWSISMELK